MTSQHNALVVFGSGPGIGRNVAALFAERGFSKVVLLSRDGNRLKEDANFVKSARAGVSVSTITIDLADTENVRTALGTVDKELEGTSLEAVLFNAARVGQSTILEFPAESVETDLRVSWPWIYGLEQRLTISEDLCRQSVHRRSMGDAKTRDLRKSQQVRKRSVSSNEWWPAQESLSIIFLARVVQSCSVQHDALAAQGV